MLECPGTESIRDAQPAGTGIFSPHGTISGMNCQPLSGQITRLVHYSAEPWITDPRKIHADYTWLGCLPFGARSVDETQSRRVLARAPNPFQFYFNLLLLSANRPSTAALERRSVVGRRVSAEYLWSGVRLSAVYPHVHPHAHRCGHGTCVHGTTIVLSARGRLSALKPVPIFMRSPQPYLLRHHGISPTIHSGS